MHLLAGHGHGIRCKRPLNVNLSRLLGRVAFDRLCSKFSPNVKYRRRLGRVVLSKLGIFDMKVFVFVGFASGRRVACAQNITVSRHHR